MLASVAPRRVHAALPRQLAAAGEPTGFCAEVRELMTIVVKKEFAFTFSTIVLERHFVDATELNLALARKILEPEAQGPGVVKSNVGGWHSENDFLRWEGSEAGELFQRVAGAVKDYVAVERRVDAAA